MTSSQNKTLMCNLSQAIVVLKDEITDFRLSMEEELKLMRSQLCILNDTVKRLTQRESTERNNRARENVPKA